MVSEVGMNNLYLRGLQEETVAISVAGAAVVIGAVAAGSGDDNDGDDGDDGIFDTAVYRLWVERYYSRQRTMF